jgi:predicted dehydrogenase
MTRRVGILGTRWGRTHVGTFRAAGCSIHAIVGRDSHRSAIVAAEEGVPRSDEEALTECDVVVIATPTESHRDLVARHADKRLFCEKPLFGRRVDEGDRAIVARSDLAVNYAFGFLDSAVRVRELVAGGSLGSLLEVRLDVGVRLESLQDQPATLWLRECAIHPH